MLFSGYLLSGRGSIQHIGLHPVMDWDLHGEDSHSAAITNDDKDEGEEETSSHGVGGSGGSGDGDVDVYLKNNEQVSIEQGPEPHLIFQPREHKQVSERVISSNIDYLLKGYEEIFGNGGNENSKKMKKKKHVMTNNYNKSAEVIASSIDTLLDGYSDVIAHNQTKNKKKHHKSHSKTKNGIKSPTTKVPKNANVGMKVPKNASEPLKLHLVSGSDIISKISNVTDPYLSIAFAPNDRPSPEPMKKIESVDNNNNNNNINNNHNNLNNNNNNNHNNQNTKNKNTNNNNISSINNLIFTKL